MSFKNIKKATELVDGYYVAIGVTIGRINGVVDCGHSAIFISKGSDKLIFHWLRDGGIRFENFNNSYYDPIRKNYFGCYLKHLKKLSESDIDSIIGILTDIREHSIFEYGYIFSGGLYNTEGEYFSENGLQEIGTCVTLCTNIFKTLLIGIDDYFYYNDWSTILPSDPNYHKYFNEFIKEHPEVDVKLYDQFHKRITPEEMTRSSILLQKDMPIRKANNDMSESDFDNFKSKLRF